MSTNTYMRLTPVGRIVQGDIWELSTKGYQGAEQAPQIYVGLAIPKSDPATTDFMNHLYGVAGQGFPQLFAQGAPHPATFAYKYHDGDDPKHQGKEGFAGHYILKLTTGFPVRVVKRNMASGKLEDIMDHAHCKRGDYVQCQYSVVSNENREKPGVFLNLGRLAQHVAYGEAIMGGANPDDVFSQQVQAPAGSSVNPTAGAMPQGQPQQQQPAQTGFNPNQGQPQQQQPAQTGFNPNQGQPQQQQPAQTGFNPNQGQPQQQQPAQNGFNPNQQQQQQQPAQNGFNPNQGQPAQQVQPNYNYMQ